MTDPAPFRRRLAAFGLDYLVIAAWLIMLSAITFTIMRGTDPEAWASFFASPVRTDVIAFLFSVLPVMLYFTASETSSMQASWGKRKMGLRVVDVHGDRVTFGRGLSRAALTFLPWQMAHTALFNIPGWPMAPADPPTWVIALLSAMWILVLGYLGSGLHSGTTLYDRLSGTCVVAVIPGGEEFAGPSGENRSDPSF